MLYKKDLNTKNTKINYLYRDASNYKVYNNCIIQGSLTKAQQATILDCLDENEYFIPSLVGLPEKKFDQEDPEEDHPWFELTEGSFEETTAQPTVAVTADELVASFCRCRGHWMSLSQNEFSPAIQPVSSVAQPEGVRILQTIETDRYEDCGDGIHIKHVGMITGREAFNRLNDHLTQVGLMPDEYFLASSFSEMDQELPEYNTAICHVDWGGNEGIYLDIYLQYTANRERKLFPFATGKTLDASGDAFLHMHRIAAECSLLLNGRGSLVRISDRSYTAPTVEQDLSAKIEAAQNAAKPKEIGNRPFRMER